MIRARWDGCEVGDPTDVPVFVLLVERDRHPKGVELNPAEFIHIAWGMCRREP